MRWLWLSCWIAAGSLSLLGSGACTEQEAVQPVAAAGAAVIGGEIVDSCAWPTTIGVNAWGSCTGTLIHPRVITTAAHCLTGPTAQIFFGTNPLAPGSFSLTGRCRGGAQNLLGIGTNRDWGYCVLPQDDRVERLPITPPLVGCEADRYLKPGTPAWVVGFGTTGPDRTGAGVKRQVEVKINAVNRFGPNTIEVGDAERGACYGDSGGPVYMRVGDATHDYGYRVLGSTTSGSSQLCNCNCSAVFVNIAMHVREIEATEGIDVTPCTDAEGRWAPSDACRSFPNAPQQGSGFFPLCNLTRTREPIQSCAGPDPSAPPAAGSGANGSGGSGGAGSDVRSLSGSAGAGGAADERQAVVRDAIARANAILQAISEANARNAAANAARAGSGAAGRPGVSGGLDGSRSLPIAAGDGAAEGASGTGAEQVNQPDVAGGAIGPDVGVPVIEHGAMGASCQLGGRGGTGWLWLLVGLFVLRMRRR